MTDSTPAANTAGTTRSNPRAATVAEAMSAADEARAWIQRLAQYADKINAENEANPIPEEMCPPTHVSAAVRLKPLPDGRVSVHEPGVEIAPDRLWALLEEDAQLHERACAAGRYIDQLRVELEQQLRAVEAQLAESSADGAQWQQRAETAERELAEMRERIGEVPRPFLSAAMTKLEPEILKRFEEQWAAAMADWDGQLVVIEPQNDLHVEFGYRYKGSSSADPEATGFDDEATARRLAAHGDTIMRRFRTDWEVVPDGW